MPILAQEMLTVPPWLSPLLQGGSFAVLVFLLVWALPQLRREIRKEHKEDMDQLEAARAAERADFTSSLRGVTVAFKEEATAERHLCEKQFAIVHAALVGLTAGVGQEGRNIVASINQHVTEAMSAYRHDLTNMINEAVLGRELYLAKKRQQMLDAKSGRRDEGDTHASGNEGTSVS